MVAYRRFQRFVAGFAIIYCVVSASIYISTKREVFPIFSWGLFTLVPNEQQDYGLIIEQIGDEQVDPPRYFEMTGDRFAHAGSISAYHAVQRLGKIYHQGNDAATHRQRRFFESAYFGPQRHVRYVLVERLYDPLERWNTDTFRSVRHLASFTTGGAEGP